jgi:hypothetical protein
MEEGGTYEEHQAALTHASAEPASSSQTPYNDNQTTSSSAVRGGSKARKEVHLFVEERGRSTYAIEEGLNATSCV